MNKGCGKKTFATAYLYFISKFGHTLLHIINRHILLKGSVKMFTAIMGLISLVAESMWFLAGYIGFEKSFPKPLCAKAEREYVKKMSEGDKEAKNKLIEHNLRLVAHIAKKYYHTGHDNDDLISIGTIGLIKAVSSFNESKNIRLATYAARCVENEILMHLRATKKQQNEVSLNESIGTDHDGNEIALMDIIEDSEKRVEESVELKLQIDCLGEKMSSVLSNREYEIIVKRYGIGGKPPLTQSEIADEMNISRSYVSRIEKKAIEKLRNAMKW